MLRHKIELGAMTAVDRSEEKRSVVPRFKPPVPAEFRRDGDLSAVVSLVKSNRYVELSAAVGSGKSTKVPRLISQAMGKLVIHTIPFHVSAHRLADYLKSTKEGEHIVYVDDVDSDLPSHGVAIMTNAHLVARIANHGLPHVQGAILYLDEIHESDCATAYFRDAAPALGFLSVVKATATAGPGVQMNPHLPGSRTERTYARKAVSMWSALDNGMPWSASSIPGNTLICVDRESARVKLASEYRNQGFEVRVLTSASGYDYYLETERLLQDPTGGIVVVLVDYAYRSSLTIPCLSRIIDSCEVAVPSTDAGAPTVLYRPAYDFEIQQFLGRGARLTGEKVEVFRCVEPAPKNMCDLEVLEADAANLLYRIFGFRPPLRLSEHAFFEGDVPIDIAASLRAAHPARLCPKESRVPWVNGHKALLEEKEKEVFTYNAPSGRGGKGKPVSCHTLVEPRRPVSPPPPVPHLYRQTQVDVDGLDEYASSRGSVGSGTVRTLDGDESDDGLSIFDGGREPVFKKPARISQRVLAERAAAEARLSGVPVTTATVTTVPDLPAAVQDDTAATLVRDPVTAAGLRRLGSVVHGIQGVHDRLESKSKGVKPLEDADLGAYVHYHDMDTASTSRYFLRGLESVMLFVEGGGTNAKGLPRQERLYAMRVLVDAFNGSTAVALGIQRMLYELSSRDSEEFKHLVDEQKMIETLQWMTNECATAQARVRVYRDAMAYYMDYKLSIIPPAAELEQRVMIEMMKKFDDAAIKKDPDKLGHYLASLNGRQVNLSRPGLSGGTRRRGIEFR